MRYQKLRAHTRYSSIIQLKAPGIAPDAPQEPVRGAKRTVEGIPEEIDEKLDEILSGVQQQTPITTDELTMMDDSLADAIVKLQSLREDGYTTDQYSTTVNGNSDSIEISLTLSKPEQG